MWKAIAAVVLVTGLAYVVQAGMLPAVERWAEATERTAQIEAAAAVQVATVTAQRDITLAGFHAAEAGTRELGATVRLLVVAMLAVVVGLLGVLAVLVLWPADGRRAQRTPRCRQITARPAAYPVQWAHPEHWTVAYDE